MSPRSEESGSFLQETQLSFPASIRPLQTSLVVKFYQEVQKTHPSASQMGKKQVTRLSSSPAPWPFGWSRKLVL